MPRLWPNCVWLIFLLFLNYFSRRKQAFLRSIQQALITTAPGQMPFVNAREGVGKLLSSNTEISSTEEEGSPYSTPIFCCCFQWPGRSCSSDGFLQPKQPAGFFFLPSPARGLQKGMKHLLKKKHPWSIFQLEPGDRSVVQLSGTVLAFALQAVAALLQWRLLRAALGEGQTAKQLWHLVVLVAISAQTKMLTVNMTIRIYDHHAFMTNL